MFKKEKKKKKPVSYWHTCMTSWKIHYTQMQTHSHPRLLSESLNHAKDHFIVVFKGLETSWGSLIIELCTKWLIQKHLLIKKDTNQEGYFFFFIFVWSHIFQRPSHILSLIFFLQLFNMTTNLIIPKLIILHLWILVSN